MVEVITLSLTLATIAGGIILSAISGFAYGYKIEELMLNLSKKGLLSI